MGIDKNHIFVSYAHDDRMWFDEYDLIKSLAASLRKHDVDIFDDSKIIGGDLYKSWIMEKIDVADIVLLLVSRAFLNSEFINEVELPRIEERARKGELVVIPILVGHCPWQSNPFLEKRQFLPGGPVPLIQFVNDRAKWDSVKNEIIEAIEKQIYRIKVKPPAQVEISKQQIEDQKTHESSKQKRKVRITIALVFGVLVFVLVVILLKSHLDSETFEENRNRFLGAMPWLKWLLYDPTEYNPYENKFPSEASIRQDLEILRRYGFDGLITVTSKNTCRHIARIAREVGFNQIIVGIWDLRDREEIDNALASATFANAYCLGHKGLGKLYTLGELEDLMKDFRKKTKCPVTTSEVLADYEKNPALIDLGDFFFPDVHTYWHTGQAVRDAYSQTLAMGRGTAELATHKKKPILLKMVSYPSGGGVGFSPEAQLEFYRLLVEEIRERTDFPGNVTFSYLCAFDPVWKTKEHGWQEPERHTGLFTADRKPKPAVTEVNWKKHL